MTSGIYQLQCAVTGERYIGSSSKLRTRMQNHWSRLRRRTHPVRRLQELADTHGVSSIGFAVLEECSPDRMPDRERFWIQTKNPELNARTDRMSFGRPTTPPDEAFTCRHVVMIDDRTEDAVKRFAEKNGVTRLTDAMRQVVTKALKSEGYL